MLDNKSSNTAKTITALATSAAHQGTFIGSLWMVVGAICFATMGILVKKAELRFGFHAYELVFWRVLVATVVLGGHITLTQKSLKTAHFKAHFWRSMAGTISLLMFFYGIVHLPLATAVTFSYTSAIFLAILSVIILKERPSTPTWLALILGLFGIALILQPSVLNNGIWPSLIGLASGTIAGYAYLQVRELSLLGEPSWRIVFYFSLIALIGSGLMSAWIGWTALTCAMLPILLGIGISALLGQLAMTHAYKVGKKFMVASLSYLVVVISTLYGVIHLAEPIGMLAMTGIVLVIISGILSGLKK